MVWNILRIMDFQYDVYEITELLNISQLDYIKRCGGNKTKCAKGLI